MAKRDGKKRVLNHNSNMRTRTPTVPPEPQAESYVHATAHITHGTH